MWGAELQSLPTNATPASEWSWALVLIGRPSNLLLLGKGNYHYVSGASSGDSPFSWGWEGRVGVGALRATHSAGAWSFISGRGTDGVEDEELGVRTQETYGWEGP